MDGDIYQPRASCTQYGEHSDYNLVNVVTQASGELMRILGI